MHMHWMLSASASLNEATRPTTIGSQFYGDLFLLVTLQNNNRHLHSPRKFFTYVTWGPWAYVSPPDREVRGFSTGSVNAEPVCRLSTDYQLNKFACSLRPGARKNFWSRGPPGNLPVSRWASPPLTKIEGQGDWSHRRRAQAGHGGIAAWDVWR